MHPPTAVGGTPAAVVTSAAVAAVAVVVAAVVAVVAAAVTAASVPLAARMSFVMTAGRQAGRKRPLVPDGILVGSPGMSSQPTVVAL